MKWLFFIVLAVNIAIYVWGQQRETGTSAALDPRFRNIGEIILLTQEDLENPPIALSSISDNAGESEAIAEPQSGAEENLSIPSPEAVAATEPTPEAALSVGKEAEVVENSPSEEAHDETPETEIPSLAAASEEMEKVPLVQAEEVATAEAEITVPQATFCWTLGPMTQKPGALNLLGVVAKQALSAELREEPEKNITGYWVLLPPYESASAANEVVKQLKSRDVIDVQRFYKGEYQNGVSLGIYNRRFNAEKRREQIEAKGFSAEVVPRYNEVPRYWIDFRSEREANGGVDLPSAFRGVTASRRECNDLSN